MYTKKMQVAGECAQIIAAETLRLNQQLAAMAWSGGMALASLPSGRGAAGAYAMQNHLTSAASRQAGNAAQNIAMAMLRATGKMLSPMHARVSAYAERLGRAKH